jgi:hypothetical protein
MGIGLAVGIKLDLRFDITYGGKRAVVRCIDGGQIPGSGVCASQPPSAC